ncbi:50S ribosomal protein L25 [Paenibacillus typhae]|uniref:Large ribosomal subunit protein bL25 n=1 Tax=Paenibacillus typhae TaxID=1174501 RepID=A0A1G8PWL2_9BACL|nr:50S ribosomal protein L25 [Paenibacillus typhae]MBY0010660.1 50S ribosomal protein L25 [Paenibacillus typhae]SDI96861.1 large subunit ribosomal protein L25 [Paenibacillus typhae]
MNTTIRLTERSGSASATRNKGFVPVVVYGAGSDTQSFSADAKAITEIVGKNPRAILKVELPDSGTKNAVIAEIQRQPLSRKLLHVDLHQIDMKSELDTKVAFQFTGDPAGVKAGGIQQVELYELDIRTLPDKLTPTFEVDISNLEIGDQLLVSDLPKHEGWEILTPEDTLVVRISPPIVHEDPADSEAVEEPAAVETAADEGTTEE